MTASKNAGIYFSLHSFSSNNQGLLLAGPNGCLTKCHARALCPGWPCTHGKSWTYSCSCAGQFMVSIGYVHATLFGNRN
ncbi:hypothetical protein BS78_01G114000 [Paspalum vaginatum]|nr:hypothetical protein BS78_01G114000 [Paspalum vaginatum]